MLKHYFSLFLALKNENTNFKSASKALCQFMPTELLIFAICMQPNNSCKLLSGSVISCKLSLKKM